jgi:hypothetical protein
MDLLNIPQWDYKWRFQVEREEEGEFYVNASIDLYRNDQYHRSVGLIYGGIEHTAILNAMSIAQHLADVLNKNVTKEQIDNFDIDKEQV